MQHESTNHLSLSRALLSRLFVCFWRSSPKWAGTSSFTRFLDHTQRRTAFGRTPLDEWSARCRDFYLTTHNTHNRQTSMLPVRFKPTISVGKWPQTYALDRTATGTGHKYSTLWIISVGSFLIQLNSHIHLVFQCSIFPLRLSTENLCTFCPSKPSVQISGLMKHFVTRWFLQLGFIKPSPKLLNGELLLFGCPPLIIECVCNYYVCLEDGFTVPYLKTSHSDLPAILLPRFRYRQLFKWNT